MDWATRHDANIQAAEPQTDQQARISCANEDDRRPQGTQPPSQQGTLASRGDDRPQVDGRSPERGEGLPQGARIRHSNEIRGLLERGKRKRTRLIDVFFTSSPASRSRMGVIVPKHGRNIVDRNRLKRRLREICRRDVLTRLDEGGKPGDVLIRARREAYGAGFDDLRNEVHKAMEGVWSNES